MWRLAGGGWRWLACSMVIHTLNGTRLGRLLHPPLCRRRAAAAVVIGEQIGRSGSTRGEGALTSAATATAAAARWSRHLMA